LDFLAISIPVLILLSFWVVPVAESILKSRGHRKSKDQGEIVIDEFIGILISLISLVIWPEKTSIITFFLAFVIFRLFDIKKFGLVEYFNKLENTWGVIMDDVVAGAQTAIILAIILNLI
jgi:phosphatidylglycerophosphatase A